jgi:hypothetical protein
MLRQQAGYIQRSSCDERGATGVARQPKPFSGPPSSRLRRSLARSQLGSRAMAAVDVSRVVALTSKAMTITSRGHWAPRAVEIYAEAVTAAQALQQPDCIVVAYSQASHADALLGHAETAGVPEARHVELARSAFVLGPSATGYGVARAPLCCWHAPGWHVPAARGGVVRGQGGARPNPAGGSKKLAERHGNSVGVCHSPQKRHRRVGRPLATTHTFSLQGLRYSAVQLARTPSWHNR